MRFPVAAMTRRISRDIGDLGYVVFRPPLAILAPRTRMNHILANRDGPKVAVIVYDMSEVNVDAQRMKSGSASLSRVDERRVDMQNG
jgi:hypothetical protein